MKHSRYWQKLRGFTLIELVIVVALVSVVGIGTMAALGGGCIGCSFTSTASRIQVISKEMAGQGSDGSVFNIYAYILSGDGADVSDCEPDEFSDRECSKESLEIGDSWLDGSLTARDVYNDLTAGRSYEVALRGYRSGWRSSFRRISKITQKIRPPDPD